MKSKISIKGILVGAVTDTILSAVAGIFVGLFVVLLSHFSHLPVASFHRYGLLDIALVLNGLSFSCLGGYVAALIAKQNELLNGALSSFLCVLLGMLFILTGVDRHPLTLQLLLLPTGPMFAALGGYLRLRQKNSQRSR